MIEAYLGGWSKSGSYLLAYASDGTVTRLHIRQHDLPELKALVAHLEAKDDC
jgi:hypothetical protein